jgi:oxygen-dependent protoporphyrinogen oxidase
VIEAGNLVVAIPAWTAADLLRELDPLLATELAALGGAPLAVVALGFTEDDLGGAPPGFGFLVPGSEGFYTLGCLWDSSIFRRRAAPGQVLMRAMIGGARHPEVVDWDDEALLATVQRELGVTMDLVAQPRFVRIIRHRHGIAQYPPGHGARLARVDERLAAHPGLFLTGSSYRGVAVNRVIEDAQATARSVVACLESTVGSR